MKTYQVDKNGYYGEFGGAYVPEILHQCVENLQNVIESYFVTELLVWYLSNEKETQEGRKNFGFI